MEEMQEKEFKKIRQNKIRNVIGIFVLLLFLGTIAFSYFHITTQGRLILREGKNVKLALDMLDVEYYGKQKSVYDSEKRNGLAEGVQLFRSQIFFLILDMSRRNKWKKAVHKRSDREIKCCIWNENRIQ